MRREDEVQVPQVRAQALPLQVEVVQEALAFAALRKEWGGLLERSGAAVFNGWEWLHPWHQRLGEGYRPYLLCARDGTGKLLGLLPLAMEFIRTGPWRVRRLALLGDRGVGSDHLDVVAQSGLEQEVTLAFAAALRERASQWDLLELLDLDEASATPRLLAEALGPSFARRTFERSICPYERFVPGEDFDSFLKRTRRRDNFLRRKKWLERQPGYRVEISTGPQELTRPLAEFFRLHALRWAQEGGSAGIGGPLTEAFHRDATWLLAEQGKLRLYTLWVGEQAVASVYGIVHLGRFHYYQSGYDPAWRDKSVGLVLVGATFEDALRLGVGEYDFLRGTEPYKADWVSLTRKTVGVQLFGRSGAGAFHVRVQEGQRVLRHLAGRLLPLGLAARIRKRRRQRAAR